MGAPENNRKSLLRKRASRLAATQALYAQSLSQKDATAAQLIKQVADSWQDSKTSDARDLPYATQPETPLFTKLVETALAEAASIEPVVDALILPGWTKARMSLPLLATLRACAAESIAYPNKSRGMLVEEYTEVAAQLVSDEELTYAHKGFNLLLDMLRKDA